MNGVQWKLITNGIPQGSVLGSDSFNILINYLNEDIKRTFGKFADNDKVGRTVNLPRGRKDLQFWILLDRWVKSNGTTFNKSGCRTWVITTWCISTGLGKNG